MTKPTRKKAIKRAELRKRDGIPAWLYMTLSFVIPVYGIIYYVMLKDKDAKRAKVALFFAIVGLAVWLLLKLIVWTK